MLTFTAPQTHVSFADALRTIRADYDDIPGLHLTSKQAQRLWDLDPATCDALLKALVDVRFLRRTPDGGFVRADCHSR